MPRCVLLLSLPILLLSPPVLADTADTGPAPEDTGDDGGSSGGGGGGVGGGGLSELPNPSGDADGYGTGGRPQAISGTDTGGCGGGSLAWALALPLGLLGLRRRP